MGGRSFGNVDLGDARRTGRLVKVAAAVARGSCCDGGGTLTSIFADPNQAKAAYRPFDKPRVTHDAVLAGHARWVAGELCGPGTHLLIEDTTAVAFHGRDPAAGLGPIGESFTQGFWPHNTLAVRYEPEAPHRCRVLGLAAQHLWVRPTKRGAAAAAAKKQATFARQRDAGRESMRWARCLASLPPPAGRRGRLVYVADRESDVYEVFERCRAAGVSFVVRANQARALAGELAGHDVFGALAATAPLGTVEVEVPRENRVAKLEVRGASVTLRGPARPGGKLPDLAVNLVQAIEPDPPAGCEPVSWTLLTDLPAETLAECQAVLSIYRHRWLVEDLHKAMKTGLRLEASQPSDARRLGALAAVVGVAACFLLQLKFAARGDTADTPLSPSQRESPMAKVLLNRYPTKGKLTWRWVWAAVAKLGGFMGRKGDGDPGWLVLWRGWQTLHWLTEGYVLRTG